MNAPTRTSEALDEMISLGLTDGQVKTVFALLQIEGWANSQALSDHGGFPVSANKLAELGLAERRDYLNRTALNPFPVAEWKIVRFRGCIAGNNTKGAC